MLAASPSCCEQSLRGLTPNGPLQKHYFDTLSSSQGEAGPAARTSHLDGVCQVIKQPAPDGRQCWLRRWSGGFSFFRAACKRRCCRNREAVSVTAHVGAGRAMNGPRSDPERRAGGAPVVCAAGAWCASARAPGAHRSVLVRWPTAFSEAIAVANELAGDRCWRDLRDQGQKFGRKLGHGEIISSRSCDG